MSIIAETTLVESKNASIKKRSYPKTDGMLCAKCLRANGTSGAG